MSEQKDEQVFQELIIRALVPPGFRPTNNRDIEALLDSIERVELSNDTIDRILAKAKGQIPIHKRECLTSEYDESNLTEKEKELLVLYRSQGKELPPEILKKLEELRKRAKEEQQESENNTNE